jgi:hypothetical protein
MTLTEIYKPTLKQPFPSGNRYWTDPKTGLIVPKFEDENRVWKEELLLQAAEDTVLQNDLLAACAESLLYWVNAFVWTYHQFDVDPLTGQRVESTSPHTPFITWEIQDELFNKLEYHLAHALDILISKCRDMGASWCCIIFLHWLWLFHPKGPQLLEMSRTREYVDQTGNHKALFQKHDKINDWLPAWMLPPDCLPGDKYRTKMHMHNVLTGATIDGESTTKHAGSGDRRLIALLDEFSKVEFGNEMRSATRDVALMRIINSTPAGPGTEYSRWKRSGQIKVFHLPFWEHPEKGAGRHTVEKEDGGWEIRSPWFDIEASVRSPKELAQEVLAQDIESGDMFFTLINFQKHKAMFASEPLTRFSIDLKSNIANEEVGNYIKRRDYSCVEIRPHGKGSLRVWTHLLMGRPDQSMSYRLGIDISKGQGASNSVISVKCRETGEKIAEWRDANTPAYELSRVAVAIAIWCGGKLPHRLPFMKWEMNGPGWDFGKMMVVQFGYPYYYKRKTSGQVDSKETKKYGWWSSPNDKNELLMLYDRVIAHGGFINHSEFALEEAMYYIYLNDGGIGPASLVEENSAARKTHGDCVIADALTLEEGKVTLIATKAKGILPPPGSFGYRMRKALAKRKNLKKETWKHNYNFLDN